MTPVPLAALAFALYGVIGAADADYRETSRMLVLARQKHDSDADLERLLSRPDVLAALRRCTRVTASGTGRAASAALLELDPAQVPISRDPVPPAGIAAISTAGSVRLATPGVLRQGAWAFVDRCGARR
jgi:4'-phosphopantetheinyl transferase EntD